MTFMSWLCAQGPALTTAVGSYPSGTSAFYGLFDVVGNVGELVMDIYDPSYYAASPSKDPKGPPTGGGQSIRGLGEDRPWARQHGQADGVTAFGFRCARPYP